MDADTFDLLPISIDPSTKIVSAPNINSIPSNLQSELSALNALHKSMIGLETPNSVPPPPATVNPKRSAQIVKLRDSGNAAFRKNSYQDALRNYTVGIEMAKTRPHWEPQGLVREELAVLYSNRAQVYMAMREWAEGFTDAGISVEMKKVQNGKAWWRGGRCLVEMGRLDDAYEWSGRSLEFDAGGADQERELLALRKEIEAVWEKQGKWS